MDCIQRGPCSALTATETGFACLSSVFCSGAVEHCSQSQLTMAVTIQDLCSIYLCRTYLSAFGVCQKELS